MFPHVIWLIKMTFGKNVRRCRFLALREHCPLHITQSGIRLRIRKSCKLTFFIFHPIYFKFSINVDLHMGITPVNFHPDIYTRNMFNFKSKVKIPMGIGKFPWENASPMGFLWEKNGNFLPFTNMGENSHFFKFIQTNI